MLETLFYEILAVRDGSGDLFALKKIKILHADQEDALRNEISAHKAVSHPNVMKLMDSCLVKNASGVLVEGILLLPFYSQGSVQDLIDQQKIDFKLCVRLGIDVCKGLKAFQ